MFKWIPYAFVRLVIFLIIGITLGIYFPEILSANQAAGTLVTCCLIVVILMCFQTSPFIRGSMAFATIIIAGYANVVIRDQSSSAEHLLTMNDVTHYHVVITQPPKENPNTWKCQSLMVAVLGDNSTHAREDKVLLYISKDAIDQPVHYGDRFIIRDVPQRVPGPSNPGEFDYREFLGYRQIHLQHYVSKGNIVFVGNEPPDKLIRYAIHARLWADSVISRYVQGQREYALASALVLGVTDGLDAELMDAYSASGAMHVLSVSGLHVGIVYWLLTLLLKPFAKYHSGKWIILIISLAVLWSYAFVTGISASVLRAVMMFSFAVVARTWNHRSNIYNILGASAFILLIFDPWILMSIGFQLSYLAVLGIVAIQPGLYKLWEPSARMADETWKVVSVSVAAQLATMSLSLYYFHQFPNYFLLTNMFVIPGSFVVLLGGIALLVVHFVDVVAVWIGEGLRWLIHLMNDMVIGVGKLPWSVWDNIYTDLTQCFAAMLVLFLIMCWIQFRKPVWLAVSMSLCVVITIVDWLHYHNEVRPATITVYAIKGKTAIDFTRNGSTFFLGDSSLSLTGQKNEFHVRPNRVRLGSTQVRAKGLPAHRQSGCDVVMWSGKLLVRVWEKDHQLPTGITADLLVISNNAVKNIEDLLSHVNARRIIFDSSNTLAYCRRLLNETARRNVDATAVNIDGAFQIIFQ